LAMALLPTVSFTTPGVKCDADQFLGLEELSVSTSQMP